MNEASGVTRVFNFDHTTYKKKQCFQVSSQQKDDRSGSYLSKWSGYH